MCRSLYLFCEPDLNDEVRITSAAFSELGLALPVMQRLEDIAHTALDALIEPYALGQVNEREQALSLTVWGPCACSDSCTSLALSAEVIVSHVWRVCVQRREVCKELPLL